MSLKSKKKVSKKREKFNPLSLRESITEELEEKGIELFRPIELEGTLSIDTDYLVLPSDLTEVPSKHLGKYLSAFTQQRCYVRTLLGWQQLTVEEARDEYLQVSHEVYSSFPVKQSESSKERMVINHPDVRPYYLKKREEEQKLSIISDNIESLTEIIFLISREISRRETDMCIDGRESRVQNK